MHWRMGVEHPYISPHVVEFLGGGPAAAVAPLSCFGQLLLLHHSVKQIP